MLPVYIFRALLWAWKGSLRWATRVASIVGGSFGILLVAFGVWRVLTGDFTGGIDGLMAEVLEDHIRHHMVGPKSKALTPELGEELIDLVRAYMK